MTNLGLAQMFVNRAVFRIKEQITALDEIAVEVPQDDIWKRNTKKTLEDVIEDLKNQVKILSKTEKEVKKHA